LAEKRVVYGDGVLSLSTETNKNKTESEEERVSVRRSREKERRTRRAVGIEEIFCCSKGLEISAGDLNVPHLNTKRAHPR